MGWKVRGGGLDSALVLYENSPPDVEDNSGWKIIFDSFSFFFFYFIKGLTHTHRNFRELQLHPPHPLSLKVPDELLHTTCWSVSSFGFDRVTDPREREKLEVWFWTVALSSRSVEAEVWYEKNQSNKKKLTFSHGAHKGLRKVKASSVKVTSTVLCA